MHECTYRQSEMFKEGTKEGDLLEGAGLFIWLSFLLLVYFRRSTLLRLLPLSVRQDFSWRCFWEAICFAFFESHFGSGSVHLPPISLSTLELDFREGWRGYIAICRHLTPWGRWLFLFSHATHWAERMANVGFLFIFLLFAQTYMFFPISANKVVKLKNSPREKARM